MASVAKRLLRCSAALAACAFGLLRPDPAHAEADARLFTPDTIEAFGDLRLVAVDGERSWVDGGFGKLRSGSAPRLASAKPISPSVPCAVTRPLSQLAPG